jgi:hypothetical protein
MAGDFSEWRGMAIPLRDGRSEAAGERQPTERAVKASERWFHWQPQQTSTT